MSLDRDQGLDARSDRAPSGEERQVSVGDITADQQAARPQARALVIVFSGIEIGQFAISPIVDPESKVDDRSPSAWIVLDLNTGTRTFRSDL